MCAPLPAAQGFFLHFCVDLPWKRWKAWCCNCTRRVVWMNLFSMNMNLIWCVWWCQQSDILNFFFNFLTLFYSFCRFLYDQLHLAMVTVPRSSAAPRLFAEMWSDFRGVPFQRRPSSQSLISIWRETSRINCPWKKCRLLTVGLLQYASTLHLGLVLLWKTGLVTGLASVAPN